MTLPSLPEDSLQHPCRLDRILCDSISRATGRAMLAANQIQFDLSDELVVYRKVDHVRRILNHVMDQVLLHSRFSQVRVTAKTYSDVVLIHIRDSHGLDEEALRPALQNMQPWVEELSGFLDITSQRPTETTIAFSFLNLNPGELPGRLN